MGDRLLSIDASSSAIGWAIFEGGKLVKAGVVKSSAGTWVGRVKALQGRLADDMGDFTIFSADCVVIEWSVGRGLAELKRLKRSAQSGVPLAHAQGAIWQWFCDLGSEPVTITETEWTGKVKKEVRAAKVQSRYPEFASVWANDPGFDATDAVGLGDWFLARERQEALLATGKSLKTKI